MSIRRWSVLGLVAAMSLSMGWASDLDDDGRNIEAVNGDPNPESSSRIVHETVRYPAPQIVFITLK